MKRHRSCGFLLFAAVFAASATASAEKPKAPQPNRPVEYGYTFSDDALLGGATAVLGFPLRIHPPPARVTLIRPRTSFVVELCKSVDNL